MITKQKLVQNLLQLNETYPKKSKEISRAFVKFLKKRNLMYQLPAVVEILERKQNQEKNQEILYLELGKKVDQSTIKEIIQKLKLPQQVKTETTLNPELKGGFRASFQGLIYEGSIQHQIIKLKNKLVN